MSQQAASRFGQDSPARIVVAPRYMTEASEWLPNEPVYQPIVPFVPASASSGNGNGGNGNGLTEDGRKIWTQYASWCDLAFYQGDDVVIPLFFQDPINPELDMSTASGFTWDAQIRTGPASYNGEEVSNFCTTATYTPPVEDVIGYTQVELFLPRSDNTERGVYRWELYSVGPPDEDLSRFPRPDGIDEADWPPTDVLRTWLWGRVYILPRGSSTDYLPALPDNGPLPITTGGWFVGPNGRVP